MILLNNKNLTECVQALRAEVTGLRKDNRELHKQDAMREDEIAALKAALAETRTRLQALLQASVAAAHEQEMQCNDACQI